MPYEHLEYSVILDKPVETVWQFLCDTTSLARWLSDGQIRITTSWKVGEPILFNGDWHGLHLQDKGVVIAVREPDFLSYSYWSSISQFPDEPAYYIITELSLESIAHSQTKLTVRQRNLINAEVFGHWNFYWRSTLALLTNLLQTKE